MWVCISRMGCVWWVDGYWWVWGWWDQCWYNVQVWMTLWWFSTLLIRIIILTVRDGSHYRVGFHRLWSLPFKTNRENQKFANIEEEQLLATGSLFSLGIIIQTNKTTTWVCPTHAFVKQKTTISILSCPSTSLDIINFYDSNIEQMIVFEVYIYVIYWTQDHWVEVNQENKHKFTQCVSTQISSHLILKSIGMVEMR